MKKSKFGAQSVTASTSAAIMALALLITGLTSLPAMAEPMSSTASNIKISTHVDSEVMTNNMGIELNKKLVIEASSSFLWWKDSSDDLALIFQNAYCDAYKSCEKEGAHLAGGFEKMPSDCSMKDYDLIQQDESQNNLYVTTGSIHFKCEGSHRSVASKN